MQADSLPAEPPGKPREEGSQIQIGEREGRGLLGGTWRKEEDPPPAIAACTLQSLLSSLGPPSHPRTSPDDLGPERLLPRPSRAKTKI